MKKLLIGSLFALALLTTSCASSGWKCTNRYGTLEKNQIHKTIVPTLKKYN